MTTSADTDTSSMPDDGVSAVSDLVEGAQRRAHDVDQAVRRFVVERPFVAIVGALAGGFLVGRLIQRL